MEFPNGKHKEQRVNECKELMQVVACDLGK